MISIAEARRVTLSHVSPLPAEQIGLLRAPGRIASEDILASWDIPVANTSAMDGYAFAHRAMQGRAAKVVGSVYAGAAATAAVPPGQAIKIMTGALLPAGCDTVVPIEHVDELDGGIRLRADVAPGAHVRRRGENARGGERVICAGTELSPLHVGLLASLGKQLVPVHRRPRVAVIATGDELVEADATPRGATIIDSNSYSIATQLLEIGAEPLVLGIARDTRSATREKILQGLEADAVVTTGGVSVGDKDHVKEAFEELGGALHFWRVNVKPGKPTAFATIDRKPLWGLPGNPVAAMIAFEQFVRPALLKMMGHGSVLRPVVEASVSSSFKNDGERPQLVLCRVSVADGKHVASIDGGQSSSNLVAIARANGLIEVPPAAALAPGAKADVTLLGRSFGMRPPCQ